jgi:hypothetical protein
MVLGGILIGETRREELESEELRVNDYRQLQVTWLKAEGKR